MAYSSTLLKQVAVFLKDDFCSIVKVFPDLEGSIIAVCRNSPLFEEALLKYPEVYPELGSIGIWQVLYRI